MSDIPEDIVKEMLSRVPAEPLLRFRCVCKEWRNIIDNPDFVKLHVDRLSGAKDMLMLRSQKYHKLYTFSLGSLDNHHTENNEVRTTNLNVDALRIRKVTSHGLPRDIQFPIPSCDGLILIWYIEIKKDWIVWNPFLGDWLMLPLPELGFHTYKVGIGYDRATNDYKVVKVYFDSNGILVTLIYSLKSNEWRPIENFPAENFSDRSYNGFLVRRVGVFVNGALHWIVRRGEMTSVIALDLTSETYREFHQLPSPDLSQLSKYELPLMQLHAWDGCLFISYRLNLFSSNTLDIWILKDYGGDNMWTKFLSYEGPSDNTSRRIMEPVAYSKSKEQVVLRKECSFLLFNLDKKNSKEINIEGISSEYSAQVFGASLIRPGALAKDGSTSKGKRKRKMKTSGIDRVNDRLSFRVNSVELPDLADGNHRNQHLFNVDLATSTTRTA